MDYFDKHIQNKRKILTTVTKTKVTIFKIKLNSRDISQKSIASIKKRELIIKVPTIIKWQIASAS